jgi:hypothetical protein
MCAFSVFAVFRRFVCNQLRVNHQAVLHVPLDTAKSVALVTEQNHISQLSKPISDSTVFALPGRQRPQVIAG